MSGAGFGHLEENSSQDHWKARAEQPGAAAHHALVRGEDGLGESASLQDVNGGGARKTPAAVRAASS